MIMKPSKLELHLLGPVEILNDQEKVKIPRRVERAILYYLAIENKPVSRSKLIDLIWPDAEQTDPRAALRTALSRLRNTLPQKDLLITELDQVSLDSSRCDVDLVSFEESYLSLQGVLASLPTDQALSGQIVSQIQDALGLWQGDHVIQGDDLYPYPELEHWREAVDRKLNGHRHFLIERLAEHHQVCGQIDRAIDLFTQLGRLNYLDTKAHLAVLDNLMKLGRYQDALDYCDALEVIFERLYNAPLPDMVLERCREAQMLVNNLRQRRAQGWPIPHSAQPALVGRTGEVAVLRKAFYSGGLVKIQGVIGVGKTRLVQALFEILTPKPLLILAPAREGEGGLPLAPIIHGFRRHIPDEAWGEIDAVWANQLALLFPELTQIRPDCNLSGMNQLHSARQHLFDALHHLLRHVAGKYGRLLFFLDDAQWADHQTFEALAYLVREGFFDECGVLIIAGRSDDASQKLDAFFDPFHRTHQMCEINLTGLNPEEVCTLTKEVLNTQLSPTLVEQMYRETEGNPLLIVEITRHLLEMQIEIEALQSLDHLPLPESIDGLIRSRINQLSEDSRHILTCACVIGDEISLDLLRAVSELPQPQFFAALDPLISARFLQVHKISPNHEECLYFSHEKLRELVFNQIPSAYQRAIHRQIAHVLSQKSDASGEAAVIAGHYLAAGDIVNAFDWLLKAAAHAWSLGAKEDANRVYQQAEELLKDAPQSDFNRNQVLQLYTQWRDYAYQSDQIDLLEEIGVKLQETSKRENDSLLMGVSNEILACACFMREDFDTGLFLIETAIKDLEKSEAREALIQALFTRALNQWWTLDFDGVHRTAGKILEITYSYGDDSQQMATHQLNAWRAISDTYYAQGAAKKAMQTAEMVYWEFYNKMGTFGRMRICNTMALAYYAGGRIDDCIHFAREGIEIVQKMGDTFFEGIILITLCKVEIVRGHLDEAYQHAVQALTFAVANNKIQTIVAANTILGDIFNILYNNDQAMHYYRIAQVRQGYSFQSYYGLVNNIHLGRLLARTGQNAEAREIFRGTLEIAKRHGMVELYIQALLVDGLIDVDEHNYEIAEAKFVKALDLAYQNGLRHEVIWSKFRLAYLAFLLAQYDRAEKYLIEILEDAYSHKMILLLKAVLDFADQLAKVRTLSLNIDEIRTMFQYLVTHLELHTQSPALKGEFINAQRLWREKGLLS